MADIGILSGDLSTTIAPTDVSVGTSVTPTDIGSGVIPTGVSFTDISDIPGKAGTAAVLLVSNVTSSVKSRLPAIVISSLALICGLAWDSFFNALINNYVPIKYRTAYSAWIKIAYAFFLTAVIVSVIGLIMYYVPNIDKSMRR